MSDLISRKEVIEWIENWADVNKYYHPYSKCNLIPIDEVIDRLQSVPSAEKIGKWIYDDEAYPGGNPYGHYNCDQCGESVSHKTNYCPNRGADMLWVKEE